MPPRPPPSPPVLTVLSCLSAVVAAYIAIGVEQVARGAAGLLAGMAWRGTGVAPPLYLVRVWQEGAPAGPTGWMMQALAGPVVLAACAWLLYLFVGLFRTAGWLRSLTLSLAVLGLFWLPTQLVAAALPHGGGPVARLYAALGNPPAGRWGTLALGVLLLWGTAAVAGRWAVATGRAWMRADSPVFRRRLVRVVAGYPAGVALIAVAVMLGWMAPGAAVVWGLVVLTALMTQTR